MFQKARYEFFSFLSALPSLKAFKQEAIKLHLGHDKIIGWDGRYPVRSMMIPGEFSPAFIKSAARLYNSNRFGIQYPCVATLSLTSRCDADCAHCTAYGLSEQELTSAQWQQVINDAMELGVFTFILSGGEPLLRQDIGEIISAVDTQRAVVLLYTNGSRLKERIPELKKAGLKRLAVSFDFAEESRHDQHRKTKGLWRKAQEGLREARRAGFLVGVSTFASPERLHSGDLENVLRFAAKEGVNEITVYDALPSGRLKDQVDIQTIDKVYEKELRALIQKWWDDPAAPGVWWYGHLRSVNNSGCAGGQTMFNVSPAGRVRPCDFCRTSVGSVVEEELSDLWFRLHELSLTHRKQSMACWLYHKDVEDGNR
ncbi:MAG: radical SAM protein [Candidatus Omnitrophota bacterium]